MSPKNSEMSPQRHQELADILWKARVSGAPVQPLTFMTPSITIEDAYQISRLNYERRTLGGDIRGVGKKIGLTSRAVQRQIGVNEPDFGYLLSDMEVPHGGELAANKLIQGRIEGEVAFVLKKQLKGPGVTNDQVVEATDHVRTCIEIIDSRVKDWKIRIQDTIADNASSAFYVLGPEKKNVREVDLVGAKMKLWVNGELRSEGTGSACMDNPLNAVAWLANTMGALGVALEPGDLILSGAYGPVVPIQARDKCAVEIAGLGRAEFHMGRL